MRRAQIFVVALTLTLGAACEGPAELGPATGPPSADLLPEGWGGIALSLSSRAAEGAELSGKLIITNTDEASDEVERTYAHIDATRVLDRVPLEPGTYDVQLEVDNADNLQTYFGSQDGVVVKAGAMTALTLFLQPAGGIEVEAWLTDYGYHFTCESELSTGQSAYEALVGAQRVEPVEDGGYEMLYYLWALDAAESASGTTTYRLFTSTDPTSWDILDATGNATGGTLTDTLCELDSVQVVGSRFVAQCSTRYSPVMAYAPYGVVEVESTDGVTWRETGVKHKLTNTTTHILSGYEKGYWYDQASGCALIADNQYNLFCVAQDTYVNDSGHPVHQSGLLHAWSANGRSWSDLPALTVSPDDNPIGQLQAFDFVLKKDTEDTHFIYGRHFPDRSLWRLLSATLEGSVYRIWIRDGYAGDARVLLTESLDRETWSDPIAVDVERCSAGDLGRSWPWAAFVVPATESAAAQMHTYSLGKASAGARPILHHISVD